jgi:hypothetical protein
MADLKVPRTMADVIALDVKKEKEKAPKLSEVVAGAIAKAIEAAFTAQADHLYNAAILTNPATFVTTQRRSGAQAVPSDAPVLVHKNEDLTPVVVVIRADGADVQEVAVSNAEGAATEAQTRHGAQVAVLLRPNDAAYVAVRAVAYPVNVVYTVIPLRGRAAVFGG